MNAPSTAAGHTPDGQPITWRPQRNVTELFVGGWRVGTYKTTRGLARAIDRWTKGAS